MTLSFATIRFFAVMRQTLKAPLLVSCPQKCVNPRNVKVSGSPDIQVILVTSFSTRELSAEANRRGAFDFLERISNSIDFFDTLKWKINLAIRFREAIRHSQSALCAAPG
jgi:PleD family two-component response regulator